MRPFYLFALCYLLAGCAASSAQISPSPKREFRGVWVATVKNIDYPKQPTTNSDSLRREWDVLMARFKKLNLNAVVMQVRPTADAFYPSKLEPWSQYLTGRQGLEPEGGFDPLAYMIRTAHANNMEFHAWLNPYRLTNDLDTSKLAPNHLFYTHRDWVVRYGTKYYADPGIPEVREQLASVVEDLVRRYELDAIHFDDYFYPYRIEGEVFPDSATYARYGASYDNIDDWRRHNVDTLIYLLHQRIKAINPRVEFGISPFGVWRNQSQDPLGSETGAYQTNYDDLFADVRKWLQEGWIDYVVPQIYFHIGFEIVDYEKLLKWWTENSFGRKLYIGMAVYRVGSTRAPEWEEPDQMPRQLRLNRAYTQVQGHVLYNTTGLLRNPLGIADSLEMDFFSRPALWPERGPVTETVLPAPQLLPVRRRAKGAIIRWRWPEKHPPANAAYYLIYRFPEGDSTSTEDGAGLYRILRSEEVGNNQFLDTGARRREKWQYRVSLMDADYREGAPSGGS